MMKDDDFRLLRGVADKQTNGRTIVKIFVKVLSILLHNFLTSLHLAPV